MLKSNFKHKPAPNQTIKLNSYKIDTSQLENKLHEVEELKSQLESTISRHRSEESSLKDELKQAKRENQKLRKEIKQLKTANKTQHDLIQQLQIKLTQTQEINQRFQEELEEEEKRSKEVQKKLRKQIQKLAKEKQEFSKSQLYLESKNTRQGFRGREERNSNKMTNHVSSEQIINDSANSSGNTSLKKIESRKQSASPQPQRVVRNSVEPKQKYKINNTIPEREEDSNISAEDVYLEMIRLLYKQLLKIELKAKDLLKIPVIDSFAQIGTPTRKDFNRLLSNYPFQIKQNHKLNLIFQFVSRQIQRRGQQFNGEGVVYHITNAVEEIQCERDLSLQSGISSAMMSQSEMFGNSHNSSGFRRVVRPSNNASEGNSPYQYYDPISQHNSESSRGVRRQ